MNYIASNTRPDISFAISSLARYSIKPGLTHWREVKNFWQYICQTEDLKLTLEVKNSNSFLNVYSNAPGVMTRILTHPKVTSATCLVHQSLGTASANGVSITLPLKLNSTLLSIHFMKVYGCNGQG
ncbi:uncharacterized protein VP01_13056g1 [Puccinia sorghi]|uniref:Uncharacterized protein n=1 Tax=Puccinia sorghi TaxID=27349 RepID=A0A0L6VN90_9BASI|nr:uncharacterized protein VP01_13056g1 [Puccinia sorghi]